MQPRILCLVAAILATACGPSSGQQGGVYEVDYLLLNANAYGLARRLFQDELAVCIAGPASVEQRRFVDLALSAWLKPLRDLDDAITVQAVDDCTTPVLKINWSAHTGRAFTEVDYDTSTVQLWTNSFYETVLHELGHAFGLNDTYNTSDQPQSVMRLGRYGEPVLYPDDIAGIQKVFTNIAAQAAPPQLYSDAQACTTTSGEAGQQRRVVTGAAEHFTRCISARDNSARGFAPRLSPCTQGEEFYGLFAESEDTWLEGVGVSYSCAG